MTAENVVDTQSPEEECLDCGYQPELNRTLGPFQVFAVSFAFISVVVAVFATYGSVLQNSGPVGIWLWVVAAVGQTMVALVVAQFAARIALSGSSYQWAASVVASAVLGFLFVITLTLAIKDVDSVTSSGSPVASIIRDQLGPVMERILLSAIVFAMFGSGMVIMAAGSRQVHAMARDARFPGHSLLRRVNPRTKTPVSATVLILVVGVVLMVALPGDALLQLIVGSSTLPALIYGAVTVLYLCVRKRLESKEGGFSLGRFELPVAFAAIIWVAIALFALMSPGSSLVPDLIVVGLIVVGGLYFAKMLIFNREVLETEPGIPDAF